MKALGKFLGVILCIVCASAQVLEFRLVDDDQCNTDVSFQADEFVSLANLLSVTKLTNAGLFQL